MDSSLLTWINEGWTPLWLDLLMMALTTAGLAWFGLLVLLAWWQGKRQFAVALFVAQMAALLGVLVFYWLAGRTRPDAVRLILAAPPCPLSQVVMRP
jgi:hypothetical protein